MKYLIFGVNGMAGHVIAQYLIEKGHEITGFARQKSQICNTIIGNALNAWEVKSVLTSEVKYDVVINCIGVLNKYVDENLAEGIYLNSVFPHLIADNLKDTETKLIHISTDCVYKGTRGNYTEKELPDAISYYGRSKALGEVIDMKNLTIRTSIVGPELKSDGIGLFHWFMKQKELIRGYTKVIWTGVTTLQLAKNIEEDIVKQKTGLYHLVNNDKICKYDLLRLFSMYCRKAPAQILETGILVSDKSLINTQKEDPFFVPGYEQMIQELADWMKKHPLLYYQYKELFP